MTGIHLRKMDKMGTCQGKRELPDKVAECAYSAAHDVAGSLWCSLHLGRLHLYRHAKGVVESISC